MENEFVLHAMLSVVTLLSVATLVSFLLRNSKIPYTVVLVLVGLLIGFLGEQVAALSFLEDFRLSPELIFYVFLPTLIFESAFHTNFRHFKQNMLTISVLSTVGLLGSALLIASGMYYILDIPWTVSLLFGVMISATDPISVLSLFKKIGAPKRLSTIIEGESLFNDGTALVLFGLLLEGQTKLLSSFDDFLIVVTGGLLTGLILGFVFSKALDYVKNSKEIEISITLILAHATFIIAEYFLGVSGILATVAAGLVVGNYGAYKISPEVKGIMEHFWDYSAFLANSLLFLLVGIVVFSTKDAVGPLLIPLGFVICLTLLARMLVVYSVVPMINLFSKREKIPLAWMHIIHWSGLRGALAVALVLTIPETFPYYQELLIFTVGVIFFTIIFNGATMPMMLSIFGLQSFSRMEYLEHEENQAMLDQKVGKKLVHMKKKGFISQDIFKQLSDKYKNHRDECCEHIYESDLEVADLERLLRRHLLGVEKRSVTKLYYHGEITQEVLHILLSNIQQQMTVDNPNNKVALGKLTWLSSNSRLVILMENLGMKNLRKKIKKQEIMLRYEMYRARTISSADAISALAEIKTDKIFPNTKLISKYVKRYRLWKKKSLEKLAALEKKNPRACRNIQMYLAQQAAYHVEDKVLEELKESGMTSSKVYSELRMELDAKKAKLKF